MKYIILLALILLIGCTPQIIEWNNTIIINNTKTITKEVIVPCPAEKVCVPTVCPKVNTTWMNKFRQCDIALKYQDEQLYKCLVNDTSQRIENLSELYDNCIDELGECEGILLNISELI